MKRQATMALQLAIACTILLSLNGCFKDNCSRTYTIFKPVYKSLTEARLNMKANAPEEVENPGKIYLYGHYIFLNDQGKGIHVIDNSQPSSPRNISFIHIPGNVDMAVNGNILYADCYTDLVAFDISNPRQVEAKKFITNVFPHRSGNYQRLNSSTNNPDSIMVAVDWIRKDTTVSCEVYSMYYDMYYAANLMDASGNYSAPRMGGIGGSMASFTLLNQYLYTVTDRDLKTFDVTTAADPVFKSEVRPGNWTIETIYPFKDKLFIGTMQGMYIYDAANPANPTIMSTFSHANSCDPVIAEDEYAFITLRSGTRCDGFTNQLDVVGITNLNSPKLIKSYMLKNPHGLSKDGNLLFICDGTDGLKVYDATDVRDIKLVKHVKGVQTYDVIAWNKKALVVAKDGLYQFDYSNEEDIRLISTIKLKKY
jgi:hypothetical protein